MDGSIRHDWYAPLRAIASKGSTTDVVGGLAGLAAARAQHQGQFWTPDAVVRLMWKVAGLLDTSERVGGYKITIFDNSFGSGRMFMFADPMRHRLAGIEIDADVREVASYSLGFVGACSRFKSSNGASCTSHQLTS